MNEGANTIRDLKLADDPQDFCRCLLDEEVAEAVLAKAPAQEPQNVGALNAMGGAMAWEAAMGMLCKEAARRFACDVLGHGR